MPAYINNMIKKYFDIKHLLIRLAIIGGIPILTMIIFFGYVIPKKYETETRHVDDGLGVMILVFMEISVIGFVFLLETVWLHFTKKTRKRNANLLIIILPVIFWLWLNGLLLVF